MSSDRAISQAESYDTCSTSTTCTTPQKEGAYYYYVILDHEAAIRKASQALREKGGSSGNAVAAQGGENGGVARVNNHKEVEGTRDDHDAVGHHDDILNALGTITLKSTM
ncbi:hypothetical protein MHU86_23983 [Fragilaria crotonensis]|nr:hypothetical protein MHU86_23983 [Fragilaria crotonensis]